MRSGRIEEIEETADHPISCSHTEGERRHDGKQEHGREEKSRHITLNRPVRKENRLRPRQNTLNCGALYSDVATLPRVDSSRY